MYICMCVGLWLCVRLFLSKRIDIYMCLFIYMCVYLHVLQFPSSMTTSPPCLNNFLSPSILIVPLTLPSITHQTLLSSHSCLPLQLYYLLSHSILSHSCLLLYLFQPIHASAQYALLASEVHLCLSAHSSRSSIDASHLLLQAASNVPKLNLMCAMLTERASICYLHAGDCDARTRTCTCSFTCTSTTNHTHLLTHISTYVNIYTLICMRTHTHTNIHTHTHP